MQILIDTDADNLSALKAVVGVIYAAIAAREPKADEAAEAYRVPAGATDEFNSLGAVLTSPSTAEGAGAASALFGRDPIPVEAIAADPQRPSNSVPFGAPPPPAPTISHQTAAVFTAPTANMSTSAENGTSATGSNTDSRGRPWDARVHSETRKTNADGTWRFRRNLDEAVKAAVLAELDGKPVVSPASLWTPPVEAPPAPAVTAPEPPPPASFVDVAQTSTPPAASVPSAPAPIAPPAPVMPPPAAAPPLSTITTFKDLMALLVTPAIQAGKMTAPRFSELCVQCGVAGPGALVQMPAKIPEVAQAVRAAVAA